MTTKPENQFISSVHKHLDPDQVYVEKMSNPYRAGGADCWYSGRRPGMTDLWIEWKFIVVPVRDTTVVDLTAGKKPDLSMLQQEWLRERYKEGRNVRVGVGSAKGGVIFVDRTWEQPFTAADFRRWMVDRKTLASQITQAILP